MTDLELDVWDAWLRERQEHLEETLSNISPSEEPCRYYLLTGYIQGMLEALTMLTTVAYTTYRFYVVRFFRIFFYFLSQILD